MQKEGEWEEESKMDEATLMDGHTGAQVSRTDGSPADWLRGFSVCQQPKDKLVSRPLQTKSVLPSNHDATILTGCRVKLPQEPIIISRCFI